MLSLLGRNRGWRKSLPSLWFKSGRSKRLSHFSSFKATKEESYCSSEDSVDPVLKEEIVVSSTEISPPPQAYQPERPTWLGTSLATQKPSSKELIPQEPPRKKTKKKTVKCPNCDKETPDLKFCKYCGYQLNKECPKCGTKVKTNVRFCSECGYNFDE
ncbi:MAG: zinc ribbon domain-containing protein [Candidatus Heimdallarchaeaceae archaeon]